MILGAKKILTDQVLENILIGNSEALMVKDSLKEKNVNVTIQGIYKALRELIAENIILKQGKKYIVNNKWRDEAEKLITQRRRFILREGEIISYKFKKIENTDAFWKNIFSDISFEIKKFPVFHFVPHHFWILIKERSQSELEYYAKLNEEEINGYTLIGGETNFDSKAKKILTSKYHQLHADSQVSLNRRDHTSVLGNYIVTTRLSNSLANAIDILYKKSKTEEELKIELEKVFKKSGSISIIIKYNMDRAKKLRKTIAKDFYIAKELREQFELF
jgi:hypothetical protein